MTATIYRDHNDIIFECDACGDTLETHDDDWNFAWRIAKDAGWRSRKIGNEWAHSCPTCNTKDE